MSTEFYLQTRGKAIDYRFLYESPSSDWWRFYAEYTLFEDKTIILERLSSGEGRLYLSGISSPERRDRVETVIRYTLVAKFKKGEGSEIFPLVIQFLNDCYKNSHVLGRNLDNHFPEQDIEKALRYTERNDIERQEKLSIEIDRLAKKISNSDPYNQYVDGICGGGLEFENSREKWLSLAKQILDGELGVAALLNATSKRSLPFLKEKLIRRGVDNAFILLSDNGSEPELIKNPRKDDKEIIQGLRVDIEKRISESLRNIFPLFATRFYLGAGVLFSAFIFLIFILVR